VVSLDTLPAIVGTRSHRAVAQDVSERSLTLIKDDHGYLPLRTERHGSILYLSVLDYPEGWGIGAPSRTFIPELEARWENVTAVELSDRTPLSELELVRAAAPRYDAVVAGVFVRTASFSGRMDLSSALIDLLKHLGQESVSAGKPFVAVLFGNPYTATFLSELPTILLTYDFYDLAEASAVRAVAGENSVRGRLPISLGVDFPVGYGLDRSPTL
jgi:beta-N-acetylhexosaminidase